MMSSFIQKLRNLPDFFGMSGVTGDQVNEAEQALGVHFATDYTEYLLNIGVMSANGHELTGITNSKRLNVVDVTEMERLSVFDVSKDWYVIEQANIDGIVVWQASSGEIYQTGPGRTCCKICDSLMDYLC